MIKYAASYYLSYYVCELRILISFFKTLTQEEESPDFKVSESSQSFNQIGKKTRRFSKTKRRLTNVLWLCKKFCESKVIIKRFLVARKLFLWKKEKKCLSLSVQCSFLGNVWMAFKHRNRRRPCYNSYTKVTLIFHAILVVSVKFLLQFLI